MYRADYVKLHYVHYSTITVVSQMSEKETEVIGESWMHRYTERHIHEFDEENEATMLHTKTKVARNMVDWSNRCKSTQRALDEGGCLLGFPLPKEVVDEHDEVGVKKPLRDDGWAYNCFLNEKIEKYWVKKLAEAVLKRRQISAPKK
jgi:hypothetical protein